MCRKILETFNSSNVLKPVGFQWIIKYELKGYGYCDEYDSTEFKDDKDLENTVICNMNEVIYAGAEWCDVYKDGELMNHYSILDNIEYEELEW